MHVVVGLEVDRVIDREADDRPLRALAPDVEARVRDEAREAHAALLARRGQVAAHLLEPCLPGRRVAVERLRDVGDELGAVGRVIAHEVGQPTVDRLRQHGLQIRLNCIRGVDRPPRHRPHAEQHAEGRVVQHRRRRAEGVVVAPRLHRVAAQHEARLGLEELVVRARLDGEDQLHRDQRRAVGQVRDRDVDECLVLRAQAVHLLLDGGGHLRHVERLAGAEHLGGEGGLGARVQVGGAVLRLREDVRALGLVAEFGDVDEVSNALALEKLDDRADAVAPILLHPPGQLVLSGLGRLVRRLQRVDGAKLRGHGAPLALRRRVVRRAGREAPIAGAVVDGVLGPARRRADAGARGRDRARRR